MKNMVKSDANLIIDSESLKKYTMNNDFASVYTIASSWLIIIGSIMLSEYVDNIGVYFLSIFVIASRMNALRDIIGHDAAHYNLFKKRKLNIRLQFLYFLPNFETFNRYSTEHYHHHKLFNTANDPSIQMFKRWKLEECTKRNFFYYWYIKPFLLFDTLHYVNFVYSELRNNKEYRNKIFLFWIPIIVLFLLTLKIKLLLLYWFIPTLWLRPVFEFWSEVSDHYKVKVNFTRNSTGFINEFLIRPYNDGYHYLHHRFPKIPSYNLKKAYKSTRSSNIPDLSSKMINTYREILSQLN